MMFFCQAHHNEIHKKSQQLQSHLNTQEKVDKKAIHQKYHNNKTKQKAK